MSETGIKTTESKGTAVRVLKIIVLCLLTLFELFWLLAFIANAVWNWDTFAADDKSVRICLFCQLGGGIVISIAEIVRTAMKKKWILLPMLGMKFTIAVASIGVSMIYEYFLTGESDSLGAGIMMLLLALALVGAGYAIRQANRNGNGSGVLTRRMLKNRDKHGSHEVMLHAELYQEPVLTEYCGLYGLDLKETYAELGLHEKVDDRGRRGLDTTGAIWSPEGDALAGKLYLYACNPIGYLVAWLIRRDGLRSDVEEQLLKERLEKEKADAGHDAVTVQIFGFEEQLEHIRLGQGEPTRFVYDYMQGQLRESYFKSAEMLTFCSLYCNENRDPKSGYFFSDYQRDYAELILNNSNWCCNFSWDLYLRLEKVLDKRYDIYRRNTANDRLMWVENLYFDTFRQDVDIEVECVEDSEWETFDPYIHRCLEQIGEMPEDLLSEICAAIVDWWGEDLTGKLTPETFLQSISDGEIQILKPYEEKLAYNLCFEATFEEENGISITIKDGHVQDVGYRVDAESPWAVHGSLCRHFC